MSKCHLRARPRKHKLYQLGGDARHSCGGVLSRRSHRRLSPSPARFLKPDIRLGRHCGTRQDVCHVPQCTPWVHLGTIHPSAWKVISRKLELLKAAYESTSEMKTVAPPVAKFGMSLGAACPSGVAMLLCSCSISSK